MNDNAHQLLTLIDTPVLLVSGDRISFANPAAISLLGSHIETQDVRIALRDPDAVKLIRSPDGGRARLSGLSVTGSVWEMACHVVAGNIRMITLQDLSVQKSVARAHADFVANASHELRTPLTSILGYVETLGDAKAGSDPDTRQRFLDIIKQEAIRMQALVFDLMSLSRIEAVRHIVPTDELELIGLCREVVGELGQSHIVEMECDRDSVFIVGDRGQIAQVIRNLVDNAVKYGKSDQHVKLTVESGDRGWVTLSVVDQGAGIAPEHLPRLTERFYRADAGRSRAEGGTGLGLSIVKHIVERHRGRFDIRSRPGHGTTASVMLPMIR